MINQNENIYETKICKLCSKNNECNHDLFKEEKFYNGITNRKCKEYKYKKEF